MGTVTKEQIIDGLTALGVRRGDTLYIHSSLKKIGWLENGPATLMDAILTVIGPEGTMATPTHTPCCESYDDSEPYHLGMPSELGAFPNFVLMHPAALRNAHPTHSSAAVGKKARYYIDGQDVTRPFAYNSTLHRIYRDNGKILLLGVRHWANTMLHMAESMSVGYTVLPYDSAWGGRAMIRRGGGEVELVQQDDFPGCSSDFNRMDGFFAYHGISRTGMVCGAESQLLESRPMIDLTMQILKEKPDFLLCFEPRCTSCTARRAWLKEHQAIV